MKTPRCEIDGCKGETPEGRVFCEACWKKIASPLQNAISDAYQLGQGCNRTIKPTQAWYDAVSVAADSIEKPGKKKHGQRK